MNLYRRLEALENRPENQTEFIYLLPTENGMEEITLDMSLEEFIASVPASILPPSERVKL